MTRPPSNPASTRRIVIVGAGFAGLATALHLGRLGAGSITLLEGASSLGAYASGRNAGLLLQCSGTRVWRRFFSVTRRYFENHPTTSFRATGSWQLGSRTLLEELQDAHVATSLRSGAECVRDLPILQGSDLDHALWTPSDGVVDPLDLLAHYADQVTSQGADIRLGQPATEIRRDRSERLVVVTPSSEVRADVVVNAAGAWARNLGLQAGGMDLPLRPLRRHLFSYDCPSNPGTPHQPYVWDQSRDFYLRPLADGQWMYCLCDEEPTTALDHALAPAIRERSRERRQREVPRLVSARETRAWACYRTKTPDGHPVLGWDPQCPGLFWVAGLGGGGMSASWELGRWAARILLEDPGSDIEPYLSAVEPQRFASPARGHGDAR